MMRFIIRLIALLVLSFSVYFIFNSIRIYNYSKEYSEEKSDVAIVLGSAINKGLPSPVFKERINHSIYLYKKGVVEKLIFTGGRGKGQEQTESEVAKSYALQNGVKEEDILIEEKSTNTYENFREAKILMDSLKFTTALVVSDPLHMKRGVMYAEINDIQYKSSPTQTHLNTSKLSTFSQLMYESFFYSLGELMSVVGD